MNWAIRKLHLTLGIAILVGFFISALEARAADLTHGRLTFQAPIPAERTVFVIEVGVAHTKYKCTVVGGLCVFNFDPPLPQNAGAVIYREGDDPATGVHVYWLTFNVIGPAKSRRRIVGPEAE